MAAAFPPPLSRAPGWEPGKGRPDETCPSPPLEGSRGRLSGRRLLSPSLLRQSADESKVTRRAGASPGRLRRAARWRRCARCRSAVLILAAVGLAACVPVGSALALFPRQGAGAGGAG